MADILTAVKSVRSQKAEQTPDIALTEVKSTNLVALDKPTGPASSPAPKSRRDGRIRKEIEAESPEGLLHLLRSQPSQDDLLKIFSRLESNAFQPGFSIHAPGPIQAQIINTLLNVTIPDFWPSLSVQHRDLLSRCLTNVAGLNGVAARLRMLASSTKTDSRAIEDMVQVAGQVLKGENMSSNLYTNVEASASNKTQRDMSMKEVINALGSGKLTSTVAQAEDALKQDVSHLNRKGSWLSSGSEYCAWLGRNIAGMLEADAGASDTTARLDVAAKVMAKALNIGYSTQMLAAIFTPPLNRLNTHGGENAISLMLKSLPAHAKRSFIEQLLRWLSGLRTSELEDDHISTRKQVKDVEAIASLLHLIVSSDTVLQQHFLHYLSDPGLSRTLSFPVRRASLACLADATEEKDESPLQNLLEKTMSTFSDQLFINHAPILQQESMAQTLLLAAGYVHRKTPMALLMTARSSKHMRGVSNRLDSSNSRARWLGMVVGTAISSLIDKEGSKMDFGNDDMKTEEARWYCGLVAIEDKIGSLQDFDSFHVAAQKFKAAPRRPTEPNTVDQMPKLNGKQVFGPPRPPVVQTEVIGEKVTELLDSDSDPDDEDELKPHAKPDSDPEDSDEDATLVNRNKQRPPVYIRDLMSMLRDDKNADRFQLGIKHAAQMIRRKTHFGAEVRDHAEEMASIFCNLQDPFDTANFDELKLQAMIALLLSDPNVMGPYFARQAFTEGYSIAQRCIILSTLGLGGRELAGFKNEDEVLNPTQTGTEFPSKRLPPRLHAIYAPTGESTKRLEAATRSMEHTLLQPLALAAADKSTAQLNAVKVRSFSSRLDSTNRTKRKPAPNNLAKIFAEKLFGPLVNRYQQEVSAYGSGSVYVSVPIVTVTFIKTLALLLHASGPATANLPEVTAEFWDLLLSLRTQAITDISVLKAVLFALLTLLEVTTSSEAGARRVAESCARQLVETQGWVEVVFERTEGAGGTKLVSDHGAEGGEEAKVRTLAAGVLVKTGEVIGAYQKQLVGYDFG